MVQHMKATNCPLGIAPTKVLKVAFSTVVSILFTFVNI